MDFFLIYLEVTIVNCYCHNFAFFDLILLAMTFTRLWRRFDACQVAVASWPVSRNRGLLKGQVPLFSENHASMRPPVRSITPDHPLRRNPNMNMSMASGVTDGNDSSSRLAQLLKREQGE